MYTSYGAQSFKAGIRLGGAVGAVGSDPSNPNAPADPANPSDPNAAGGGSADVLAEMERSMSQLKVLILAIQTHQQIPLILAIQTQQGVVVRMCLPRWRDRCRS